MGEGAQYCLKLAAKADNGRRAGLLPVEANNLILPVDILGGEFGDIGLSSAQVPAAFIVGPALGIGFIGNNGLVLSQCDRTLFFEANLRPASLRQYGPRKPGHIEGKVMASVSSAVRPKEARPYRGQSYEAAEGIRLLRPCLPQGHLGRQWVGSPGSAGSGSGRMPYPASRGYDEPAWDPAWTWPSRPWRLARCGGQSRGRSQRDRCGPFGG